MPGEARSEHLLPAAAARARVRPRRSAACARPRARAAPRLRSRRASSAPARRAAASASRRRRSTRAAPLALPAPPSSTSPTPVRLLRGRFARSRASRGLLRAHLSLAPRAQLALLRVFALLARHLDLSGAASLRRRGRRADGTASSCARTAASATSLRARAACVWRQLASSARCMRAASAGLRTLDSDAGSAIARAPSRRGVLARVRVRVRVGFAGRCGAGREAIAAAALRHRTLRVTAAVWPTLTLAGTRASKRPHFYVVTTAADRRTPTAPHTCTVPPSLSLRARVAEATTPLRETVFIGISASSSATACCQASTRAAAASSSKKRGDLLALLVEPVLLRLRQVEAGIITRR